VDNHKDPKYEQPPLIARLWAADRLVTFGTATRHSDCRQATRFHVADVSGIRAGSPHLACPGLFMWLTPPFMWAVPIRVVRVRLVPICVSLPPTR
jgi:hypothetical protein